MRPHRFPLLPLLFSTSHTHGSRVAPLRPLPDPSNVFNVIRFGAVGDGSADDTAPVARAVASAAAFAAASSSRDDGGPPAVVLFPPGRTYLTGPLNVSSHMTLQVEGTILALGGGTAGDYGADFVRTRWPQIPPLPNYGASEDGRRLQHQAVVYGRDLVDVRIIGGGTIDGGGEWWWDNQGNRTSIPAGRPNLIQLWNGTNVEIGGVTLRDSPFWAVHVVLCRDVHIHHTTIRSRMYALNSDGIDPDSSRNVLIEHNDVSVGDDHVAIKAGRCGDGSVPTSCLDPLFLDGEYYCTENVTVRNNIFRTGMGIAVGSETSGTIRDVDIYDNVVGLCRQGHCEVGCCGWGPALHIKTAPSRGGAIENVSFRNNTVYNTTSFILMELSYQSRDPAVPTDYPPTAVRNITFQGNRAMGGGTGVNFACVEGDACEEIQVVDNVVLHNDNPWGCHFVKTYEVSGNHPPGLEECMEKSMNRTDDPFTESMMEG